MEEPTRVKADLIPYAREYERDVISWIDSPETYKDLCRGTDWPPPADLIESWQRKNVTPYILISDRQPIAYGEIWDRALEMAAEIAHVLVAPVKRGEGYGVKMLQLLYNRAAGRPGVAKVMLNLYSDNQAVLGCYLKAGFELVGTSNYTTGLKMIRVVK